MARRKEAAKDVTNALQGPPDAFLAGRVAAYDSMRDWTLNHARTADPRQVRGLRRVADYCARRLDELDPDGAVRELVATQRHQTNATSEGA